MARVCRGTGGLSARRPNPGSSHSPKARTRLWRGALLTRPRLGANCGGAGPLESAARVVRSPRSPLTGWRRCSPGSVPARRRGWGHFPGRVACICSATFAYLCFLCDTRPLQRRERDTRRSVGRDRPIRRQVRQTSTTSTGESGKLGMKLTTSDQRLPDQTWLEFDWDVAHFSSRRRWGGHVARPASREPERLISEAIEWVAWFDLECGICDKCRQTSLNTAKERIHEIRIQCGLRF